jgi:hypothetical protein
VRGDFIHPRRFQGNCSHGGKKMRNEASVRCVALWMAIFPAICLWLTAAPSARAASLTARYVGSEEDRVGELGNADPNGREDAHFRVTLDTQGLFLTASHIMLRSADADGRPDGSCGTRSIGPTGSTSACGWPTPEPNRGHILP